MSIHDNYRIADLEKELATLTYRVTQLERKQRPLPFRVEYEGEHITPEKVAVALQNENIVPMRFVIDQSGNLIFEYLLKDENGMQMSELILTGYTVVHE